MLCMPLARKWSLCSVYPYVPFTVTAAILVCYWREGGVIIGHNFEYIGNLRVIQDNFGINWLCGLLLMTD